MAAPTTSNSPSFWKNLAKDPNSCVKHVNKKIHFLFPPYYFENVKKSVKTIIDQKLNSYQEDLGGLLAGHGNISVTKPNNEVFFNKCESHVDIVGDFYVFNPSVGSQLTGIVNKVNQGQIGCLTHGLFNISLPKPFALPIQSWLGSSVKIHDEILFTIIKVDFGSHVPYIQGNIEEVRPRAADPTTADTTLCKQEELVEESPISTSKVTLDDSSECIVEEAMPDVSPDLEAPAEVSSKEIMKDTHGDISQLNSVETSTSTQNKKRKRVAEDPIGVTPTNKRPKSESSEPGDDDENQNLVINLFAQVSESILSTPASVEQKSKKKKTVKDPSTKTRSNDLSEENNLVKSTPTPKTPLNSTTSLSKSAKSSSKKKKKDDQNQNKLDKSTEPNGSVSSDPCFVVEKKSASSSVGAFVVEKINRSVVRNPKKSSKSQTIEETNDLMDPLGTPKQISKSNKKKKNPDTEETVLLDKEITNNILKDSDTPRSVSKSGRKKKNAKETEENELLTSEKANNLLNAKETSKSAKKKKTMIESEDNKNTEENELIIKELLGSALSKTPIKTTPIKTTPKVKAQKRKSLSAKSDASIKKEKDSPSGDFNVTQQIMKIMQQVQGQDKTKKLKKRSL